MKRSKRITHSVDPAEIEKNAGNNLERRIFSQTLNSILEERGIDQIKMANDLHLSTGAIHNYRAGITDPKLTTIVKMADYLGVDCDYLIRGVESKHTDVAELGLTNESIEKMLWLSTGTWKRRITAFNLLINTRDFIFVLDYLDEIRKLCESVSDLKDTYQAVVESSLENDQHKAFKMLDNLCGKSNNFRRDLRYKSFELSEAIKSAANAIYGYDEAIKQVSLIGDIVFDKMNKSFDAEIWNEILNEEHE